jgi:hypothetical protein
VLAVAATSSEWCGLAAWVSLGPVHGISCDRGEGQCVCSSCVVLAVLVHSVSSSTQHTANRVFAVSVKLRCGPSQHMQSDEVQLSHRSVVARVHSGIGDRCSCYWWWHMARSFNILCNSTYKLQVPGLVLLEPQDMRAMCTIMPSTLHWLLQQGLKCRCCRNVPGSSSCQASWGHLHMCKAQAAIVQQNRYQAYWLQTHVM